MKNKFLFIAVAVITGLFACTKENNGIQLQPHDDNRMMDTMHAMMSRMEAMPKTNDPEIDFSKMMIMHHQGAINMANVQLQEGKNDSLKRFSQKIIAAQQAEIQQFNTILSAITVDNSDPAFTKEQMDYMMKGAKAADVQIITGDIDNDFATLMIVHHQGAIDNASAYLHHGNHTQLKTMAQKIIDAQVMEIQELANWLKANKR
ncbi:MAG: DUF305 domain-containing protein [Sediminibacterium sp.]